jgi:hypothetical protein
MIRSRYIEHKVDPTKKKRLAIFDIDKTLLDYPGDQHLLNKSLVAKYKLNPPDVVYICTHRYHGYHRSHMKSELRRAHKIFNIHRDPFDIFTMQVAENFMNAIGLPLEKLVAISTPDDKGRKCGEGIFRIQKIEEEIFHEVKMGTFSLDGPLERLTYEDLGLDAHHGSAKDEQLRQILDDAKTKFPGVEFEITFIDDKKDIRLAAKKAFPGIIVFDPLEEKEEKKPKVAIKNKETPFASLNLLSKEQICAQFKKCRNQAKRIIRTNPLFRTATNREDMIFELTIFLEKMIKTNPVISDKLIISFLSIHQSSFCLFSSIEKKIRLNENGLLMVLNSNRPVCLGLPTQRR